MPLSVIVTSFESPAILLRCLLSLGAQEEVSDIVVSDCSAINPALALQDRFPQVRFRHFEQRQSVPVLRWTALNYTRETMVAAIEARCVPAPAWSRDLLSAHRSFPDSPAIGGVVLLAPDATAFECGLYFCEYGAFAPPVQTGPVLSLSGANLCYRRNALNAGSDLTSKGEWESLLHDRWLKEGRKLILCPAAVTFYNSMSPLAAMRQRWHYGRGYAADRVRGRNFVVRCCFAAVAVFLPVLLTCRITALAFRKQLLTAFFRGFFWLCLLNCCWSLGELVGYLAGKDPELQIF